MLSNEAPSGALFFFAYRDVGMVVPAHPCASRHLDILSIVAGGRERSLKAATKPGFYLDILSIVAGGRRR